MTETIKTVVVVDGSLKTVRMPSRSRKGVTHTVTLSCTCEGFQYNGYCYHLAEAADITRADSIALRTRTKQRLNGAVSYSY